MRALLAMTLVLPALNGCLWHTRKVPKAQMPTSVLSAQPEQLVAIINKQYDAISSMSAAVQFTATEGGALKGSEKTIAPFSGYILLRKPDSLRVIGYLPVVHSPAFDMASNGQGFKLWIPPKNKAIEGPNAVTQASTRGFENLRPYMFFDSLVIPKIGPDELRSVTGNSNIVVNPKTRKLEVRPEYLLMVGDRKDNSNLLQVERVIHFSRLDLRPIELDLYGPDGQVQTQATYGPLQTFGTEQFPGSVTIRWPQQQEQLVITIQKLRVNLHLSNDQFELKIPEGAKVQRLQ